MYNDCVRRGDVEVIEVSAEDEKFDPMAIDDVIIEVGPHNNDLTVSTILSLERTADVLEEEKADPLLAKNAEDDQNEAA